VDPVRFYEDGYRDTLATLIAGEVASQGPLRRDRLIQRIARLHGFQRAGREIQERIEAAIPSELRKTYDSAGTFIWPMDQEPAAARMLRTSDGTVRDPVEIPIEQLRALAVECGLGSREETEVLAAMRNACGLSKMGAVVRARLVEAMGRPAT